MKKSKSHIALPLFLTVIPANIWGVISIFECDSAPYNYIISYPTIFLALASLISLILIHVFNIEYVKIYKDAILTGIRLLLGVVPIAMIMILVQNEDIALVTLICYPILGALIIANKVRLTLKKHGESSSDKPRLAHVLAITFINPLLPFLPLPMGLTYGILLISIHGLGIK